MLCAVRRVRCASSAAISEVRQRLNRETDKRLFALQLRKQHGKGGGSGKFVIATGCDCQDALLLKMVEQVAQQSDAFTIGPLQVIKDEQEGILLAYQVSDSRTASQICTRSCFCVKGDGCGKSEASSVNQG